MRVLGNAIVQRNYLQIKQAVQENINSQIERVFSDPGSEHLGVKQTI